MFSIVCCTILQNGPIAVDLSKSLKVAQRELIEPLAAPGREQSTLAIETGVERTGENRNVVSDTVLEE